MGVARARSGRLSLLNARGTQAGLTLLNSLGWGRRAVPTKTVFHRLFVCLS